MLFAFSSEQVASVFPKMFEGGKDLIYGNTDFGTLFGGAATGLLQTMIDLPVGENITINNGGWRTRSTSRTRLCLASLAVLC